MLTTQNRVSTILLPSIFTRTMAAIEQITPLYPAVSLEEIQDYALWIVWIQNTWFDW